MLPSVDPHFFIIRWYQTLPRLLSDRIILYKYLLIYFFLGSLFLVSSPVPTRNQFLMPPYSPVHLRG
jgi:hypothetical protein